MESAKSSQLMQLSTFFVGRKEFAVDALKLREIIRYTEPTKVPCAERFVEGAINFRGVIVPIINMRARLGMPDKAPDQSTRIVNVEIGDIMLGFVVDSMGSMRHFPADEVAPPPALLAPEESQYVLGVCDIEGSLVLLVDLEKMFSTEFLSSLAAM